MTDLIPLPRYAHTYRGHFELGPDTRLVAGEDAGASERWLRGTLGAATGFPLAPGDSPENGIQLYIHPMVTKDLGPEGYRLMVQPHTVHVVGGGPAGLFWGAQTLRQLLGPDAFRRAPLPGREWRLPLTHVQDSPVSPGAASCSTWPGTSCPRKASCATWISWRRTNSTSSTST